MLREVSFLLQRHHSYLLLKNVLVVCGCSEFCMLLFYHCCPGGRRTISEGSVVFEKPLIESQQLLNFQCQEGAVIISFIIQSLNLIALFIIYWHLLLLKKTQAEKQ